MARKTASSSLQTSKHEGQQSSPGGMQSFFLRNVPMWNPPAWQEAEYWRRFVEKQPFASICRDAIANYLNSLDWMIVARDSEKKDELSGQIKHYTKLFERGNAYWWDIDFSSQVEWFVKDLFTLPFGTASELGRLDDNPKGRVVWIRPLDAGTLAPTLNFDFPVVQSAPGTQLNPVYLQREFVSRTYLSPRTELRREGWGYAPPERIWRAIEMMSTGDNYYAQLLMDTPEAGLLDLGDMDETSAKNWVKGLEDIFVGVNPFKIPVLYEHEKPAQWIPFGRPPSELMYDSVTLRYAALLCAGYGLTLSDIGIPSSAGGGETLAGTIRMERVGKSSGKAVAKKKHETYRNQMLPNDLKFVWIDYDDERNVSKGRARLASAQAGNVWVNNKSFLPSEMRRQAMADGLVSIDLPEEIDENDPEFQNLQQPGFGGNTANATRPSKAPSQGGQGQIIPQQVLQKNMVKAEVGVAKAVYNVNEILAVLVGRVNKFEEDEIGAWEEYVDEYLTGKSGMDSEELKSILDDICSRSANVLKTQDWVNEIVEAITYKIIEVESGVQTDKAQYRASQKAEQDFIEGKGEGVAENVILPDLLSYGRTLHGVNFENMVQMLSKYIVLVSKSHILHGKLEVDATEFKDNNIRVSREIGKEVLQNLSSVVREVYELGLERLGMLIGENNAIS